MVTRRTFFQMLAGAVVAATAKLYAPGLLTPVGVVETTPTIARCATIGIGQDYETLDAWEAATDGDLMEEGSASAQFVIDSYEDYTRYTGVSTGGNGLYARGGYPKTLDYSSQNEYLHPTEPLPARTVAHYKTPKNIRLEGARPILW
jgi:hypothetical protein